MEESGARTKETERQKVRQGEESWKARSASEGKMNE